MQEPGEACFVVGRFRPLNEREEALEQRGAGGPAPRFGPDGRTVWVGPDEAAGQYALDAVLPPEATQQDVYVHASGLVDSVMHGYNATILAYGQTGSGKTHSVMGASGGDGSEESGLLPRAVRHIFEAICNDSSGAEFAVTCSYLEIYKEAVRDLLNPTSKAGGSLPIREAVGKGVYVEGLTEVPVMGEADVLECFSCGNASRMVGATLMNAQSSRSHALMTLHVQQKLPDGSTKESRLNIADLAGSEKVGKTGSSGETLQEAKKINSSLSALSNVITALSDGRPHIPYRNSKLTRILQESLGGNSKTMMLVACSPAANNSPETHSTLRFATQCKRVRNVAVVNRVLSADQLATANAALRLELQGARERIKRLESGSAAGGEGLAAAAGGGGEGGTAVAAEAVSGEEVEQLREQVETLELQLQTARDELADEQLLASRTRTQLKASAEEVEMLYDTLARFQVRTRRPSADLASRLCPPRLSPSDSAAVAPRLV